MIPYSFPTEHMIFFRDRSFLSCPDFCIKSQMRLVEAEMITMQFHRFDCRDDTILRSIWVHVSVNISSFDESLASMVIDINRGSKPQLP